MNKRSQVEIMGLIIIVILVAVAMIFVLQFMVVRRAPTIKTYSQAEIAENMLTAMRYTTTECNSLTMSELLKKCVEEPLSDFDCPGNMDYCEFVEQKANYLFEQTLDKWNRPYKLSIFIPEGIFDYNKTNPNLPCKGERRAATHILKTDVGLMTIRLDVCD
jgi:hypothetical protein